MSSIILSAGAAKAGSAIGAAFGGPIGGLIGGAIGSQTGSGIGSRLDDAVFGPISLPTRHGPRLADLSVQTSTYGKMIPIVYGQVRISGNIIWSQPIKETVVTTTTSAGGGKGGGGTVQQTQTNYQYSVTLAIAICEGPIDEVIRVWADAAVVDLNASSVSYRIYKGDEDQTPDSVIEAMEGAGNVPAYRGLAYVVIEDFPLEAFGNRIPNFTFEIKKKILPSDLEGNILEDMVEAVVIIPGSGEFVYDTTVEHKVEGELVGSEWAQAGKRQRINLNNRDSKADVLASLDQLENTCPNVGWVAPVVTWFGNSLDAGTCVIKPGVEYQTGATTEPNVWGSGGYDRSTAHQITLDENNSPIYGGTPDDDSVIRLLSELKGRGYKVMFYPMFFMDVEGKPWRGRVTGSYSDVDNFFIKTNGYNDFIIYYANLVKDYVDAFIIGSELIGLTKVKNGSNQFPAVDRLVALAASVKAIVGSSVKVTYAADWSEYHHTDDGWYNMDPLWASSNIDVVGIDAYFPLTDEPQISYDVQKVIDGWTSGEGYDFYYADAERTDQQPLSAPYAWKNIAWWWSNNHVNPDSSTTAWVPESKKIWFTEYGFPSVDGATNQPNVFYDPNSTESYFPRFSRGRIDFRAQRLGLLATELKWQDSAMIERKFIWTWDARPFPFYPDLTSVWADGPLWQTGHWVEGKLGLSSLAAIVMDLCNRVGLAPEMVDVSRLTDLVEGMVLASRSSARSVIEDLQQAYFFDAAESDSVLKFVPRGQSSLLEIGEDDLVPTGKSGGRAEYLSITRRQEVDLPQQIDVNYIRRLADYQLGNQHAERQTILSQGKQAINLSIVLTDQEAKNIAEKAIYEAWLSRTRYSFSLAGKYADLEPADVITINNNGKNHVLRVTDVSFGKPGILNVQAVSEDVGVYDTYASPGRGNTIIDVLPPVSATTVEFLDIPALPSDNAQQANLRIAATGVDESWKGAVLYRSDDEGGSYQQTVTIAKEAAKGKAVTLLSSGPTQYVDLANTLDVLLMNGELESVSKGALLNGLNLALVGNELVQFQSAELIGPNKYRLSQFLRGRMGTESEVGGHAAGEEFILLDDTIAKTEMPSALFYLPRLYKPVSIGSTLGATSGESFSYTARALKPFAPVHIVGERDGSGDLTIDWVRRTRVGGEWRDGVDVPLSEVSEKYEVEILDGSTVVHQISGLTSAQASYSAAEQVSDFGSAQAAIDIRIYQISEAVGRGIPATATV